MNAKEITIKNIEENGFRVGKAVRGKGYELYAGPYYFASAWGFDNPDSNALNQLLEKILQADIETLYVQGIRYKSKGDGAQQYFEYKNIRLSQSKVDLKELVADKFESVCEISIYCAPDKLFGYFPISKYTSDLDSQKEMIVELLSFEGKELYSDELFDYDDEWAYDDDIMSFGGKDYNGDYGLVHGDSYYMENTGECEYVDGRLEYHNSMIVDDFWNLDYKECFKSHFEEHDPKDKICVYHRKGKDWYVGYQYESQELMISYRDEHGEICEDEFYALYYEKDAELVKKFVDVLESWRDDLSAKSYIYNELEIGEDFSDYYNDEVVNQTLVELIYEDKDDLRDEIVESIKSWKLETIKEEFARAYNATIDSKIKVEDDLSVQITTVPMQMVTNVEEAETMEYKHLKTLKKLGERFGYELVKTNISQDITTSAWAIKIDEEEYHFDIAAVIVDAINDEVPLLNFINDSIEKLYKRKAEKLSQLDLFEKATHVFVGINDSLESGNCSFGTNQFIAKHHIDTKKIGGVRGDVLLKMELSNFTKRAVMRAIVAHGGVAC